MRVVKLNLHENANSYNKTIYNILEKTLISTKDKVNCSKNHKLIWKLNKLYKNKLLTQ